MLSPSLQLRVDAEIELRRRMGDGETDAYTNFKVRYFSDLEAFARDCIQWPAGDELSEHQAEAMRRLVTHRRFSMRGPHGLGKTCYAAIVILWFALTRDGEDWKIPVLASAWRQLTKFLFPELHKWARLLRWDVIGRQPFTKNELLTLNLKLSTGEAFAIASDTPAFIEGAHADHILYVFDESKAIPDETWNAAEGAMSTSANCYWLAISTPGEPQGRFYEIHSRATGYDDWNTLFVTLEMAIASGRINAEWAAQRRKQWGENSTVYKNRVLGEFSASDEDGIISLADIERANLRWQIRNDANDWGLLTGLGVDIGRGGDPSVIAREYDGRSIRELEHNATRNSMEIAGRVTGILQAHQDALAVIDLGYDPGVYDRCKEDTQTQERVIPFVASAKEEMSDETGELHFSNLRSAAWWNLREMLKNDEYDIPPDDKLTGDLTAPHYQLMSGGKIQVESKDASAAQNTKGVRKRLGRSTDDGDAVVMIAMRRNLKQESSGSFGDDPFGDYR